MENDVLEPKEEDSETDEDPRERATLRRELELCRRERAVAERELELVRRRVDDLGEGPNRRNEQAADGRDKVALSELTELIGVFDGSEGEFANWEKRIRFVKNTYSLTEEKTKVLMSAKMKGKALEWFHSRPEILELTLNDLFNKMKGMFDHRPRKLALRKQFEDRMWNSREPFSDYVHDKVIMGNRVPVDDEEMVDYVIEGIPDMMLRNQGKLQNFTCMEEVIHAFEKVSLRRPRRFAESNHTKGAVPESKNGRGTERNDRGTNTRSPPRCFNCQETGHLSKDCTKSRKSRSCFKCGEEGHFSRDCPKTKRVPDVQVTCVRTERCEDEDFQRKIQYELGYDNEQFSFSLKTLFDTGSPISFIKEKFILNEAIETIEISNSRFHGINDSELNIVGKVCVNVTIDDAKKENFQLYVVDNNTMTTAVVLGRDVLNEFGLTLACEAKKNRHNVTQEILNINVISGKTEIVDEEHHPFHFSPRRLSHVEKIEVRKKIDELLQRKIIRPSESEYASPIVLTKKKNGETRMCVDYRTLNSSLARDNQPLPIIEDRLDLLEGKKYFSLLDLKDGFHHIRVAEESIKYTAFVTPFGQFEKPAPARFTRYVNKVLENFIRRGEVVAYMDDFLISTETLEHPSHGSIKAGIQSPSEK
ncbi:PREDICTED: uncharacterized protein LOC107189537 [Dufourea novaeangliae]|uniref:uncharacterized protein LOC107189537 n=1 Tax=Dufourea novaeangliae TaxID=178035 RepID=UPI000767B0BB|nr:PREDICTED: uncharacterized protein LOC107189537 [Dufourea novaeangliae]